jgi:WD40 repeat protein
MGKLKLLQYVVSLVPLALLVLLGARSARRELMPDGGPGRPGACLVLRHADTVRALAFDPAGKWLATGEGVQRQSGAVRVWDWATGAERACFRGHRNWVCALAFDPDGRTLRSASYGGVRSWDLTRGEALGNLRWRQVAAGGEYAGPALRIKFHPDSRVVALSDWEGGLRLWDVAGGRHPLPIKDQARWLHIAAFSADGRWLAAGSTGGAVQVWDVQSGDLRARLPEEQSGACATVALSPDGRRLALEGWEATVRIWDVAANRQLALCTGHVGMVLDVAFSPDGQTVASAGKDGVVKLWDTTTGQELASLKGHTDAVNVVAFSPDGTLLASGSDDQTVRLWRLPAPKELRKARKTRTEDGA